LEETIRVLAAAAKSTKSAAELLRTENKMGFGIMLIGYILMSVGIFASPSIAQLAVVAAFSPFLFALGGAVVLYSLKNLIYENKGFSVTAILGSAHLLYSIAVLFLNFFIDSARTLYVLSLIQRLFGIVVFIALMYSIYLIAKSVELPQIQTKAITTVIALSVSFVFMLITAFASGDFLMASYAIKLFAMMVFSVAGFLTVFNSYVRICYEDDIDMEKKPTSGPVAFLDEKLTRAMTPKEKKNKADDESKKDKK
jgi:hypothetical protein